MLAMLTPASAMAQATPATPDPGAPAMPVQEMGVPARIPDAPEPAAQEAAAPAALPSATPTAGESAPAGTALRILTLEEALKLALANNLVLKAKERELNAVQANEITAGLIPNPTLSPSMSNGFARNIGPPQYQVVLSQPLELWNKRQRRVESAEAGTRITGFDLEDQRRLLTLQVKQSFTAILAAKQAAEQTRSNLKALDDVERLQRLRVDKGDLSELDLLRIQQQRFQFESDAADAQQALILAQVNLRQTVGHDLIPEAFDVSGGFALMEVRARPEDLYRQAAERRADLKVAEAQLDKAHADNRLAQAYAVPNFAPSVGYCWADNNSCYGFTVGFSLDLPLFNRNQGEIQRTARDAERVGALTSFAQMQIRSDVDTALTQLENARIKLQSLRDIYYPKAKEIRARVELAYRRGAANLLDFLDAERTYRTATLAYINSQGNYDVAVYQLEAAIGGPIP
jgi:cobalt-zinc-cadmium efflux system outer membrane protein